ncbi:MAG: ATP-binding protein [Duodenibacillus sp.]|nr:ATP-binding protein [Duodenibacillus sp.]
MQIPRPHYLQALIRRQRNGKVKVVTGVRRCGKSYLLPEYLEKLDSRRGNGMVKVVTGVRRCGKSFLVFDLFKKHLIDSGVSENRIIGLAFDEFPNKNLRDPNVFWEWATNRLDEIGEGERYVLLDEVPLHGDFETVLIGLMRIPGVDVYVTGSNARLLSRDIVTEFRGRGDEVRLRPLSFSEFMSVYSGSPEAGYQEYALYGGLPSVVLKADPQDKATELKALLAETYLNDIIARHRIRNKQEFEDLLNCLASSIGSLTSPLKISKTFASALHSKISMPTVKNYLDHLCDAFLIETSRRYDIKGRRHIGSPFKCYFSDIGLRNARLGFRQLEATHTMENIVFNELRSRGFDVDVGVVPVRRRNNDGEILRSSLEIDFVCNLGFKRYYIQSAFSMPDASKENQEKRPLSSVEESFKKIIITHDLVPTHYDDNGILIISLLDFLSDPGSLET